MVKQRRGLGVAHVLEPVQVLVGDLPERHLESASDAYASCGGQIDDAVAQLGV